MKIGLPLTGLAPMLVCRDIFGTLLQVRNRPAAGAAASSSQRRGGRSASAATAQPARHPVASRRGSATRPGLPRTSIGKGQTARLHF